MKTPISTSSLKEKINGKIILPNDDAYDDARSIYNAMIDKRPALIVKCKNKKDVQAAVDFARTERIEVSVRGGGHNGAGLALVDGGLVIDLSLMKDIKIDPENRTAVVQAGCLLKEVDNATHEYGLALPGGIIGTTGVSGLTLGGGIGYLSRKGGLTVDRLIEAEVVLASGEIVTASKNSDPDLFWAIRGGGGNFGVVTSFTFNLLPIKNVYAGPMFWPLEKAHEAMKFYDQITKNASNDLYGFFAFLIVPPGDPFPEHLHSKNVCGIVWCYTGPMEKAEEVFKPIREFGPPILDFVGEIPMPDLNGMFDELYPSGMQWYWRAHFIKELTDDAISENIRHGSNIPTMHSTTHLYPIDGAVHDMKPGETAWAKRDARWSQVIVGVSPDPENADTVTTWCKNYYDGITPYSDGGAYVNFMMEEGESRIKASYGDNYGRLKKVKAKYDPNNFFHINQNIKPA
ncbi:FAD-binding oxidoreductase [Rhodohalobacter sulfatireducens]|uniref:FAD-binding oxidoreductase n=1 Tax=Rhodohalobacter sulfatireducens TaxID=2911366 RepID=A0ABS9KDP5_9BACT|nr:FAD-binding oxidoreductase [Rhodohalobacter sulfatireducens]MCG2588945.1 FAD-binding oxidoreductase [Rhodohalobacter sulfatireducens]